MTEIMINLVGVDMGAAGIQGWSLKKDAAAVLRGLRERGLNTDDCVRIHPASSRLFRFWVIARPDPLAEMTWIMGVDGSWSVGRMYDDAGHGAPWTPQPSAARVPATFTHITRTVPDRTNQRESYRTKSNGSCGRFVTSDDSIALCTCGWKKYEPTRGEAQSAARAHREELAALVATP
jgi:hypothetical protein